MCDSSCQRKILRKPSLWRRFVATKGRGDFVNALKSSDWSKKDDDDVEIERETTLVPRDDGFTSTNTYKDSKTGKDSTLYVSKRPLHGNPTFFLEQIILTCAHYSTYHWHGIAVSCTEYPHSTLLAFISAMILEDITTIKSHDPATYIFVLRKMFPSAPYSKTGPDSFLDMGVWTPMVLMQKTAALFRPIGLLAMKQGYSGYVMIALSICYFVLL